MASYYGTASLVDSANIRVIELLLPATEHVSDDVPIGCTLHTISLYPTPTVPYTALSYTWGSSDANKTIILNGEAMAVRSNLWNFLHEARRRKHQGLFLWIDAIAIDQGSIAERNSQVSRMSQIYQEASSVTIWLGQSTPNIELAFERMTAALPSSLTPEDWRIVAIGVKELSAKDYWTRAWILQEFILAREREVWCGRLQLDGRALLRIFLTDDNRRANLLRHAQKDHERAAALYFISSCPMRKVVESDVDRRLPLKDLMARLEYPMQCADVRDRVFAVRGLVTREDELSVRPDYSATASELFVRVLPLVGQSKNEAVRLQNWLELEDNDENVRKALESIAERQRTKKKKTRDR